MTIATKAETKEEKPKRVWIYPRRKRNSLTDWFMMKHTDVFEKFLSLPNARKIGEGQESAVYVPGTRSDRALLVAHADTVWNNGDADINVVYSSGTYASAKKGVGIGADDRAGCAILWKLRDLGHSLLIPNAEESGCIGSRFVSKQEELSKELNEHQFAIEFDRMHDDDLVFYSVGSAKFKDWCEEEFTGYKRQSGSFTDICVLCDTMTGVNISVGYYNQHSPNEILIDSEWNRTLSKTREVLSKANLPKFIQDPPPPVIPYRGTGNRSMGFQHGQGPIYDSYEELTRKYDPYDGNDDYYKSYRNKPISIPSNRMNSADKLIAEKSSIICDSILVCPHCDFTQHAGEYEANSYCCTIEGCGKRF